MCSGGSENPVGCLIQTVVGNGPSGISARRNINPLGCRGGAEKIVNIVLVDDIATVVYGRTCAGRINSIHRQIGTYASNVAIEYCIAIITRSEPGVEKQNSIGCNRGGSLKCTILNRIGRRIVDKMNGIA